MGVLELGVLTGWATSPGDLRSTGCILFRPAPRGCVMRIARAMPLLVSVPQESSDMLVAPRHVMNAEGVDMVWNKNKGELRSHHSSRKSFHRRSKEPVGALSC